MQSIKKYVENQDDSPLGSVHEASESETEDEDVFKRKRSSTESGNMIQVMVTTHQVTNNIV